MVHMKLASVLAVAAFPMPLPASDTPAPIGLNTVVDEVRCVLVANQTGAAESDPQKRQVDGLTEAYFLGRIESRPPAQVRSVDESARQGVTPDKAQTLLDACIAVARGAEDRVRELGK